MAASTTTPAYPTIILFGNMSGTVQMGKDPETGKNEQRKLMVATDRLWKWESLHFLTTKLRPWNLSADIY